MRIHDFKNDKAMRHVNIYLTLREAKEMIEKIEYLIEDWPKRAHEIDVRVSQDNFERSVTIAVYSPLDDLKKYHFSDKAIEIIEKDE